jgi:hypothetical protein
MPQGDWRSPATYDYAVQLDPAGLAWEFLRRNPDYRTAFAAASRASDQDQEGPGRRWGLRFPDRPGAARRRSRGVLVAR